MYVKIRCPQCAGEMMRSWNGEKEQIRATCFKCGFTRFIDDERIKQIIIHFKDRRNNEKKNE